MTKCSVTINLEQCTAVSYRLLLHHLPQALSHNHLLSLLHHPLPSSLLLRRRLKHQHNRTSQLESSHLLTPPQRMSTQHGTGLLIRRLHEPQPRLAPTVRLGCCPIRCRVSSETVGSELAVKVDLDGADVGGADRDVAEESPAPAAEKYDALVEGEEAGEGALEIG